MRNKIFAAVIAAVFLFVFIYAPVHVILMNNGIIPYETSGNIIKADKVYDESHPLSVPLNAIEEGKRTVVDTYTNHIPFYTELTTFARGFKRSLNEPLTKAMQKIGDGIIRDKLKNPA